jgi:hypothetical protein
MLGSLERIGSLGSDRVVEEPVLLQRMGSERGFSNIAL